MNFIELCLKRFSARNYTDEPISDADLQYILESFQVAPSAVNRQPWKFLIAKSEEAKEKVQRAYDRDWLKTAPLYIIAFKNILKEAERMEREAMDRFHSWSNGMMDPAEDEVYTNAVRECAGRLRKESA